MSLELDFEISKVHSKPGVSLSLPACFWVRMYSQLLLQGLHTHYHAPHHDDNGVHLWNCKQHVFFYKKSIMSWLWCPFAVTKTSLVKTKIDLLSTSSRLIVGIITSEDLQNQTWDGDQLDHNMARACLLCQFLQQLKLRFMLITPVTKLRILPHIPIWLYQTMTFPFFHFLLILQGEVLCLHCQDPPK